MSIFPHTEAIYNSTRTMRSESSSLYRLGKRLDKLKGAIHRSRGEIQRANLIKEYHHYAEKLNRLIAGYSNHLVKINAHLIEIRKELSKP